jgi:protein-tyrosine phosphatase
VEVAPNLWLGPRLNEASAREAVAGGVQAVLDLAAELPECRTFRELDHYRSLPILETRAPDYRELHEVIRWVNGFRALGPVYVHCALGHGRSATVVVGYLVLNGECTDWEVAEERLRALRPGVKIKPGQRAALERLMLRLRD